MNELMSIIASIALALGLLPAGMGMQQGETCDTEAAQSITAGSQIAQSLESGNTLGLQSAEESSTEIESSVKAAAEAALAYIDEKGFSATALKDAFEMELSGALCYSVSDGAYHVLYGEGYYSFTASDGKVVSASAVGEDDRLPAYDTLVDAQAALAGVSADTPAAFITRGRDAVGDGGHGYYAKVNALAAGQPGITADTVAYALASAESAVNVYQLGYDADGESVNAIIDAFHASAFHTLVFPQGDYRLTADIYSRFDNRAYYGFGATLYTDSAVTLQSRNAGHNSLWVIRGDIGWSKGEGYTVTDNNGTTTTKKKDIYYHVSNIELNGLTLERRTGTSGYNRMVSVRSARNVTFNRCAFDGITADDAMPASGSVTSTSGAIVDFYGDYDNVSFLNSTIRGEAGIDIRDLCDHVDNIPASMQVANDYPTGGRNVIVRDSDITTYNFDEGLPIFAGNEQGLGTWKDGVFTEYATLTHCLVENVLVESSAYTMLKPATDKQRVVAITCGYQDSPVRNAVIRDNAFDVYANSYLIMFGYAENCKFVDNDVTLRRSSAGTVHELVHRSDHTRTQPTKDVEVSGNSIVLPGEDATLSRTIGTSLGPKAMSFTGNDVTVAGTVERVFDSTATQAGNAFHLNYVKHLYDRVGEVANNTYDIKKLDTLYESYGTNATADLNIHDEKASITELTNKYLLTFNGTASYNGHSLTFTNCAYDATTLPEGVRIAYNTANSDTSCIVDNLALAFIGCEISGCASANNYSIVWDSGNKVALAVTDPIYSSASVAAMRTNAALVAGDVVRTKAYYAGGTAGDEAAGTGVYDIEEHANWQSSKDDGGRFLKLSKGNLWAVLRIGDENPTVDLYQYGARGDGATDDREAVQAALRSGAATVHVLAGTYLIGAGDAGGIALPSNITLVGDDREACTFIADEGYPKKALFAAYGSKNITLRGVGFSANIEKNPIGDTYNDQGGISLLDLWGTQGTEHVTVEDCRFFDNAYAAVRIMGGEDYTVRDCAFSTTDCCVITLGEVGVKHLAVTDNTMDGHQYSEAITLFTTAGEYDDVLIARNTIRNKTDAVGIFLRGKERSSTNVYKNVTIEGNTVENCAVGLGLANLSSSCKVLDNTVRNNATWRAAALFDCEGALVDGLTVTDARGYGLWLENCTDVIVRGLDISGFTLGNDTYAAVRLDGAGAGTTVAGRIAWTDASMSVMGVDARGSEYDLSGLSFEEADDKRALVLAASASGNTFHTDADVAVTGTGELTNDVVVDCPFEFSGGAAATQSATWQSRFRTSYVMNWTTTQSESLSNMPACQDGFTRTLTVNAVNSTATLANGDGSEGSITWHSGGHTVAKGESATFTLVCQNSLWSEEGDDPDEDPNASKAPSGSGTQDDPFIVSSAGQLLYIAESTNASNGTTFSGQFIELGADIDLSGIVPWTPIGSNKRFSGTFDGKGHSITGLSIDGSAHMQGLFKDASFGALIKNLHVEGSVKSTGNTVGGIVASLGFNGRVEGCSFTGAVSGGSGVGGIAGNSNAAIVDCAFSGSVSATASTDLNGVGGIVGYGTASYAIDVSGCTSSGSVTGQNGVGGIVGSCLKGSVSECLNEASVIATGYDVGGIVGYCRQQKNTNAATAIEMCGNVGAVSGLRVVGGIAGVTTETIADCYNEGSLAANFNAGGIAGAVEGSGFRVSSCYNAGSLPASGTGRGGIAGSCGSGTASRASGCFYLQAAGIGGGGSWGSDQTGRFTGITSAQLADQATFSGWDFDAVWRMDTDRDRPVLRAFDVQEPEPDTGPFASVAVMRTANVEAGATVETLAYYEGGANGDATAGAGTYDIEERADWQASEDDGGSRIRLDNGNWAVLRVADGTVNVRQFGARGDGKTDGTAATANANATTASDDAEQLAAVMGYAVANPGTTVYFPEGIYCVSRGLEVPAHTTLIGTYTTTADEPAPAVVETGKSTTLGMYAGGVMRAKREGQEVNTKLLATITPLDPTSHATSLVSLGDSDDVAIDHLAIDAGRSMQAVVDALPNYSINNYDWTDPNMPYRGYFTALTFGNNKNVKVADCIVRNNVSMGCQYNGGENVSFERCDFLSVDVGIQEQGANPIKNIFIHDCYFEGHDWSEPVAFGPSYVGDATGIWIERNTMRGVKYGHAIAISEPAQAYVDHTTFKDIHINGNTAYDMASLIGVSVADGLEMRDNKGYDSGQSYLYSCKNVTIDGLEIHGSARHGLLVGQECENVNITGLVVENYGQDGGGAPGIDLLGAAKNVSLEGRVESTLEHGGPGVNLSGSGYDISGLQFDLEPTNYFDVMVYEGSTGNTLHVGPEVAAELGIAEDVYRVPRIYVAEVVARSNDFAFDYAWPMRDRGTTTKPESREQFSGMRATDTGTFETLTTLPTGHGRYYKTVAIQAWDGVEDGTGNLAASYMEPAQDGFMRSLSLFTASDMHLVNGDPSRSGAIVWANERILSASDEPYEFALVCRGGVWYEEGSGAASSEFSSLAALREATGLAAGRVVNTLAYREGSGKGGASYLVCDTATAARLVSREAASLADDGGRLIGLAGTPGMWAVLAGVEADAYSFGAYGDGGHDDAGVLQALLDSGLESVRFSDGTYLVGKPLVATERLSIAGAGADMSKLVASDSLSSSGGTALLSMRGVEGFSVSGVGFAGWESAAVGALDLLRIDGCARTQISGCAFGPATGDGIAITGSTRTEVGDCTISGVATGIHVGKAAIGTDDVVSFMRNEISNVAVDGIAFAADGSTYEGKVAVYSNTVTGAPVGAGILLAQANRYELVEIGTNVIDDCYVGIRAGGVTGTLEATDNNPRRITSNTVRNATYGIIFERSSGTALILNEVYDVQRTGIYLDTLSDCCTIWCWVTRYGLDTEGSADGLSDGCAIECVGEASNVTLGGWVNGNHHLAEYAVTKGRTACRVNGSGWDLSGLTFFCTMQEEDDRPTVTFADGAKDNTFRTQFDVIVLDASGNDTNVTDTASGSDVRLIVWDDRAEAQRIQTVINPTDPRAGLLADERAYASVAAMQADSSLAAGDVAATLAYYVGGTTNSTTAGAGTYDIKAAGEIVYANASKAVDGGRYVALDNGLVAELRAEDEAVDLYQYGAHGDGADDDSARVQAALDSGFATVRVSTGSYVCGGAIIPSGTSIVGSGRDACAFVSPLGEGGYGMVGPLGVASGARDVALKGITVDGRRDVYEKTGVSKDVDAPELAGDAAHFIYDAEGADNYTLFGWLGGATNVVVEGCCFKNNNSEAVKFVGGKDISFTGCEFLDVDCGIITQGGGEQASVTNLKVDGCTFDGHWFSEPISMFAEGSSYEGLVFTGNTFKNKPAGSAILLYSDDGERKNTFHDVTIANNTMRRCSGGLALYAVDGATVEGNDLGGSTVRLYGCSDMTFEGLAFKDCPQFALLLRDCAGVKIAGLDIDGFGLGSPIFPAISIGDAGGGRNEDCSISGIVKGDAAADGSWRSAINATAGGVDLSGIAFDVDPNVHALFVNNGVTGITYHTTQDVSVYDGSETLENDIVVEREAAFSGGANLDNWNKTHNTSYTLNWTTYANESFAHMQACQDGFTRTLTVNAVNSDATLVDGDGSEGSITWLGGGHTVAKGESAAFTLVCQGGTWHELGEGGDDPDWSGEGYDYWFEGSSDIEEFPLFVSKSDNLVRTYAGDKYVTNTADAGYVVLKAPAGKKFSRFTFHTTIGGTGLPRAFAYSDAADVGKEDGVYELTLAHKTVLVRSSINHRQHFGELLPDDAHYLMIQVPATTADGAGWAVRLHELGFDVVDENTPLYGDDLQVTVDFGEGWDDVYDPEPYVADMIATDKTVGNSRTDGNAMARKTEIEGEAYFTLQAPSGYKISGLSARTVSILSEVPVNFECATDADGAYLKVPTPKRTEYKDAVANWSFHEYAFDALPADTRFVRIRIPDTLATWSLYVDDVTMQLAKIDDTVAEMPESEYAALNERPAVPENPTSGTVASSELFRTYRDDPYVLDFDNWTTDLQPYRYDDETRTYVAVSALVVDDPSQTAHLTLAAPDQSTITRLSIDAQSWNTYGNVVVTLHPLDAQMGELGAIPLAMSPLDYVLRGYEQEMPADTHYVRIELSVQDITVFKGNDLRFSGYSFDWEGAPADAGQGMKTYTMEIDASDVHQTFAGWGVRPSSGEPEVEGTDANEVKDAVLGDLGVNAASIRLYSDFDPTTRQLTAEGEEDMATTLRQLEAARAYGLDYLLRIQSPPKALKSNGSSAGVNDDGTGATLLSEYEDAFCDYVVLCLGRIRDADLPMPFSLSITNEPEGVASWDGCYLDREQYVRVTKMLDAKLDAAGFGDIQLHGPESASFWSDIMFGNGGATKTEFANAAKALDDEEFADAFDVYGFHSYGSLYRSWRSDSDPVELADIVASLDGRDIWQTEFTSVGDVAECMQHICRDLRLVGAKRWFYWYGFAPDTHERPEEALIIGHRDGADVSCEYTPLYDLLKATFNGIPADSQIIGYSLSDTQLADRATGNSGCDVICNASAYTTPNGSAAILVNDSQWKKAFDVKGLSGDTAKAAVYDADADKVTIRDCAVENGAVTGIVLNAGDVLVLSTESSDDPGDDPKETATIWDFTNAGSMASSGVEFAEFGDEGAFKTEGRYEFASGEGGGLSLLYEKTESPYFPFYRFMPRAKSGVSALPQEDWWVRVTYKTDDPAANGIVAVNNANGQESATLVENTSVSGGEFVTSPPVSLEGTGLMQRLVGGQHVTIGFTSDLSTSGVTVKEIAFFPSKETAYAHYGDSENVTPPAPEWPIPTFIAGAPVSDYRIVVSAEATAREQAVAEKLRADINEASGQELEIRTDASAPQEREILVGLTNRSESTAAYAQRFESPTSYSVSLSGEKVVFSSYHVLGLEAAESLFASYALRLGSASVPEKLEIDSCDLSGKANLEKYEGWASDSEETSETATFSDSFDSDEGWCLEGGIASWEVGDGAISSSGSGYELSYLHVYGRDVVFAATMTPEEGDDGSFGVQARYTSRYGYVRAGYDFAEGAWFIESREGEDFVPARITGSAQALETGKSYSLVLSVSGKKASLSVDGTQVAQGPVYQLSPGRVAFFSQDARVSADDVAIAFSSGTGRTIPNVAHTVLPTDSYLEGGTVISLADGKLHYLHNTGVAYASSDGGITWESEESRYRGEYPSVIRLANGSLLRSIRETREGIEYQSMAMSVDEGVTWTVVGTVCPRLHGEDGLMSSNMNDKLVQISTGRVFYTQTFEGSDGVCCDIYYSDDDGATWTKSQTSSRTMTGNEEQAYSGEGKVLECADGSLRYYCSWNDLDGIFYSESLDGGVTWGATHMLEGFDCARSSMAFARDPQGTTPTTYYMVWCDDKPVDGVHVSMPRSRLALAYSEDGKDWRRLGDVWRWESNFTMDGAFLNHLVDPFVYVADGRVLVGSGASEKSLAPSDDGVAFHQAQRQHIWSISKEELSASDPDQEPPAHVHVLERVTAVPVSCSVPGAREHWRCADCGKLFADADGAQEVDAASLIIPATGHDWGEWQQTEPPTCTEAGNETRVCKNNSLHAETREVAALGHIDDGGKVTREATEDAEGEITHTCARCGEVLFTETIPKKQPDSEAGEGGGGAGEGGNETNGDGTSDEDNGNDGSDGGNSNGSDDGDSNGSGDGSGSNSDGGGGSDDSGSSGGDDGDGSGGGEGTSGGGEGGENGSDVGGDNNTPSEDGGTSGNGGDDGSGGYEGTSDTGGGAGEGSGETGGVSGDDGGKGSSDASKGGESSSGTTGDVSQTYTIILNPDGAWGGSATGYAFSSSADFSKFVCVLVDGATLDSACYDVESGSTKVTLHADYLSTLAAGAHTATIRSTDGEASTTFTIQEVQSGSDSASDTQSDGGTGSSGGASESSSSVSSSSSASSSSSQSGVENESSTNGDGSDDVESGTKGAEKHRQSKQNKSAGSRNQGNQTSDVATEEVASESAAATAASESGSAPTTGDSATVLVLVLIAVALVSAGALAFGIASAAFKK